MTIRIVPSPHPQPLPDSGSLGFGRHFSDHMFSMWYDSERGWHNATIEAYQNLPVAPGNLTLHYGQSIFEGLKAYRRADGSVALFRAADHIERFRRSARRLCMPDFDPGLLLEAFERLVDIDRTWVPSPHGTALYLRPTLVAMDNALGVRPSRSYLLLVIASPVGSYYTKGAAPTRILVEERYTRATMGGLGEAKTSANYAASLLAAEEAKSRGFDQVLWLDAKTHTHVEEVGTMNIFFVIDGVLVTPPLGGTILDGITRRTVLTLASEWDIPVRERPVSMEEIVQAQANGTLQECFGSGTAAIISPVGELYYSGRSLEINERENPLRERLYNAITGIQYGRIPDLYGWTRTVPERHGVANGNGSAVHAVQPAGDIA